MSTGKTLVTSTQFSAKKLLGKAQTSNLKTDVNESVPSNVSMPSDTIFAEPIPNSPGTAFYTIYSSSASDPGTVEQVYLDVVSFSDTIYDADDAGGGGDEASANGAHGYYLKLPSNYQTTSSNPNRGTGPFTNSKRIYDSRGALQLVPPLISNASPNRYFLKVYKGDPSNPANEITSGDSIDWQVDYYSGIIFIQDYDAAKIPVSASAYIYVGKYLNEKLEDISGSVGGGSGDASGQGPVNSLQFHTGSGGISGSANLLFANNRLALTGTLVVSGTIQANTFDIIHTNLTEINASGSTNFGDSDDDTHNFRGEYVKFNSGIVVKRLRISSSQTITSNNYYIGVDSFTPSGSVTVTLPDAATLEDGQVFVIKDEGGKADLYNVLIEGSGSQKIDNQNQVVLESPHASLTLYCDGVSKFYIG